MNEIEVKVLDIDTSEVIRTLKSLGCNPVKKEQQENYIYSLPDIMSDIRGYVRIRRVKSLLDGSTKDILCIKKLISQDSVKSCEEHETEICDFNACTSILKALGLSFLEKRDKQRESYLFNDTLIEIDTWDTEYYPEPYIELEGESSERIYETLTLLGIPHEKATSLCLEEIKKLRGIE
jgi:adenylate cyclase class 2